MLYRIVDGDDDDDVSFEDDDDGSHVVAADAGHGVGSHQSLQQVLHNLLGVLLLQLLFYNIYNALVILNVILPDPVAT